MVLLFRLAWMGFASSAIPLKVNYSLAAMLLKVCRLIVCKALIFMDGYTQKIWRESTRTKNEKGSVAGRISRIIGATQNLH